MPKAGDKYVIEIESVFMSAINVPKIESATQKIDIEIPRNPLRLYRIKGFNSLVFDDQGLSKLEKYEPENATTRKLDDTHIDIGDEVKCADGNMFIATYISEKLNYISGITKEGNIVGKPLGTCVRTGRHNSFLADAVKSLRYEE